MTVRVEALEGAALQAAISDLAQLRITVFAAFPYLYDGDADYEQRYLAEFTAAKGAVLVAAFDKDRIVGAATASPLLAQEEYIRAPFEQAGIDTKRLFYFGESVLLPQYRGQGIGHVFFDHRERGARAWGADRSSFCAVVRPPDHPLRPAHYQPLDRFWTGRGYAPVPGLTAQFAWKDHSEPEETDHTMQFWMKDL